MGDSLGQPCGGRCANGLGRVVDDRDPGLQQVRHCEVAEADQRDIRSADGVQGGNDAKRAPGGRTQECSRWIRIVARQKISCGCRR